jgi:hypothetical protein
LMPLSQPIIADSAASARQTPLFVGPTAVNLNK